MRSKTESRPALRSTVNWHAIPAAELLAALDAGAHGLDSEEAARRLERFGANTLRPPKTRGAIARLLLQFHNVLIYVLLGAAVITAGLDHWIDSGVIVAVVVINALIGFVQEGKAEKALAAIRDMLSPHALVLRDGRRLEIGAEGVVPGDVALLQSGDKVPADLRLIEIRNLRIDEAALTGESEPVEKNNAPVAADAPIGDRFGMAYAGTLVTFGQARGVVIATGASTEIGRISDMLAQVEDTTTPLVAKIAVFARRLSAAILALGAAVFAFSVWSARLSPSEAFMAVVGIAVAAIPEGLPAIMTITLAIGVQRMAKRNAIIRRLPAVETLGSVTVICSDKTGTLTRNEMTVQRLVFADRVVEVSGVGYAPEGGFAVEGVPIKVERDALMLGLARAAMLCNDAVVREQDGMWVLEGDPTEGALYTLGLKAGLDPHFEAESLPRTDVIPFESEHRFMATLHHDHEGHGWIYLKGAPERVIELCRDARGAQGEVGLDREYWQRRIEEAAGMGQRVLAIAVKPTGAAHRELVFSEAEDGFTLLGLTSMIDPPREEAVRAIRQCRAAGIAVKMITGDHATTAAAVGAMLGLGRGRPALTGAALDALDEAGLAAAARDADVFARTSPEHKLRLVKALQGNGEIVAMTGDGVNDSPALKRADVGVAMGKKGTEAAKEASEMVIADDNFASIASAVEEGRTVYDNIKKFIVFVLPTNGGEAGVIILAILAGLALPITPVQILWVNMVTAVTLGLAFAFEPAERGSMARPPRPPAEPLLSGFLVWRIVFVSLLLVAGITGLFLWDLDRGEPLASARTVAVNLLVMGEAAYLFNSRYLYAPSITVEGFLGNRIALIAIAVLVVLQLSFTYLPVFQALFGSAGLDAEAWLLIGVFGILLFLVVELEKAAWRFVERRRSASAAV